MASVGGPFPAAQHNFVNYIDHVLNAPGYLIGLQPVILRNDTARQPNYAGGTAGLGAHMPANPCPIQRTLHSGCKLQ
jgi:hypothetical protein